MALTEQQIAVVLQACIEHARGRIEEQGGFLPFGARAKPDGEIEFVEAAGDGGESVEAVYRGFGAMLAEDARANTILAGALVANAGLPEGRLETAIAVLVEAPDFCRSIVVPYRFTDDSRTEIEFGQMVPEAAEPIIFAG